MRFTYDAYRKLISNLRDSGYAFATYHNYEQADKCVIMRHDIDYSIRKSVKLAELECDMGIKSTYFVLISSPFYNVISNDNRSQLQRIIALGHDVGLHFDELNYSREEYKTVGGIEKVIFKEVKLLEEILNHKICSVSMHRPSKETLEADYNLGKIVNSYGKRFFDGFKYVSDSHRRWREDVEGIIAGGQFNKLHILTHAFWYNDKEIDIKRSLQEFISDAAEVRYDSMNKNITGLAEIMEE